MEVNQGWEERLAKLKTTERRFGIIIEPLEGLNRKLTVDERKRMMRKLLIVRQIALKLADGMLKGTVKYKQDVDRREEWLDYLDDDLLDAVNYLHLMKELSV